jgi:DNA-binding response OmpR family regulator
MTTHLLLVEDDDTLRTMLARTLRKAGHQMSEAADGDIAVEMLQQATAAGTMYDVVLTDIVMGATSGVQVTETALQQPAAPEVILLTAHGSLDTAVESLRYGAFDYLLKPVETAHLLARIAAAVEKRRARLHREYEAAGLRTVAGVLSDLQGSNATPARADAVPPAPDTAQEPPRYRQVAALRIDTHRHEVWLHEERIHVTPTEYAILACLAETPEQVVRYEEMIHHTHGQELPKEEAHTLLSSHIRNLRRKLNMHCLVAVRSVGYMLTADTTQSTADS